MAYKPPPPRSGLREERALLMDVKNGKAEAFDTFHEQHAAALYRLGLAMAARPEAAVETVEAAFRKALVRSASWPEEKTLADWLASLVVEAGNRQLRSRDEKPPERPRRERRRRGGTRREKARREAPPERPLPRRPVKDWAAEASEEPLRLRLRELAGSAGPRLPELLRAAWALVDRTGRNARQAGEILDLSPAMVSSRVHRARLRIREDLARAAAGVPGGRDPERTVDGKIESGPARSHGTSQASGREGDLPEEERPETGEKDRT
jgi:RNA polymerase sigma-70 factor (ECF subfamily)